jgi:hypothetical protein
MAEKMKQLSRVAAEANRCARTRVQNTGTKVTGSARGLPNIMAWMAFGVTNPILIS